MIRRQPSASLACPAASSAYAVYPIFDAGLWFGIGIVRNRNFEAYTARFWFRLLLDLETLCHLTIRFALLDLLTYRKLKQAEAAAGS